ncbi:glutathione S-transferase [Caulobacter sp. AP07]|uniref:glutathione S-transferase family protein n=1 Tax=Caulobacter sp. AP07 TaxID=1144304 RepID=UPI000271E88A|nr:glutathione S-transferase family protein [Caulobacter sp. AP07]EJL34147.1 glutathione S-transferase [Caulobacter sp. AP07]
MTSFVVHGVPGSPYVRATLLGLEEKGLPYRLAALAYGEHKGEAHRQRHPFGRIPVLDHGDLRLYETQAILRYLDRIAPSPPLTPADPVAEARMNQLIGICDWYVIKDVSAGITFHRVVAPRFGLPVDEAAVAQAIPGARTCVGEIARLLGDAPFLTGQALSLADLMLAPHLAWLAVTDEGRQMLGPHPALAAWIDRMNARPSMILTTWERLAESAAA